MKWKKLAALMLGALLCIAALSGCGNDAAGNASGGKTLTIGDTTFNSSNEEPDINPHNAYAGWACIRYGVGETLVKYSDTMELQPWLATKWENTDPLTWKLILRDDKNGPIPVPVESNQRSCACLGIESWIKSPCAVSPT